MRNSKSKIEGHGERISSISCEGIDWMLLVEMSVVTTISFLAHLVPALRIYIYIYARTVHADAHLHTYKQHGRVQLCAPVLNYSSPRETASLLFLSPFLLRSGRARTPPTLVPFPHPRPLPPPLGFSLSFPSYFFPSFSLSFLLAYNLAKRKSGPLAREIFSKTFLIFPASHSPGISPRRNFYSSSSPFFFRFLSFSRRNSPRRGRNAFLARFRARITDFGKLRISNFFRGYNILRRRKKGKNPAFWITIFD